MSVEPLNRLEELTPWKAASKEFAETAKRQVPMFRSESGVSPNAIWVTHEFNALLSNKQVTGIILNHVAPK